jgi:hypothetical protein
VERNNKNGLIIDIYDLEDNHLDTLNITIRPVCEF